MIFIIVIVSRHLLSTSFGLRNGLRLSTTENTPVRPGSLARKQQQTQIDEFLNPTPIFKSSSSSSPHSSPSPPSSKPPSPLQHVAIRLESSSLVRVYLHSVEKHVFLVHVVVRLYIQSMFFLSLSRYRNRNIVEEKCDGGEDRGETHRLLLIL